MNNSKTQDPNGKNTVTRSSTKYPPGTPGNNAVSQIAEGLILSMANSGENEVKDQNDFNPSSSYPGG